MTGRCKTGADALFEVAAGTNGWGIDPFPFTKGMGKAGGPHRNQRMVDVGADIACCMLDLSHESRGTRDMLRRLKSARIPVLMYVGWTLKK